MNVSVNVDYETPESKVADAGKLREACKVFIQFTIRLSYSQICSAGEPEQESQDTSLVRRSW